MTTITQVSQTLQPLLTEVAQALGRSSGFVQRRSKLDAASFVQTLVLGWLDKPDSSLAELCQMAAAVGVSITPQGLDNRFTPEAAALLLGVLQSAIAQVVAAVPAAVPLLARFNGVYLHDSTQVALPAELAPVWQGNGGKDSGAALKLQLRWEWLSGQIVRLDLQPGRTSDNAAPAQTLPLPAGALRLADLGYFRLETLAETAAAGAFFLTRLKYGTRVFTASGAPLNLLAWLKQPGEDVREISVLLGAHQQLACRLVTVRVPPQVAAERRRKLRRAAQVKGRMVSEQQLALAGWTLLLTNAPAEKLNAAEAVVVAAVRWQMELLFKLWKSQGQLGLSRSGQAWRQLCEIYAKLLGQLIQHWLVLLGCWDRPDRSLVRAAQTVRRFALSLALAMHSPEAIEKLLIITQRCLAMAGRLTKRRQKPSTYQRLATLEALA
jgi:DDE family transposase